jgi:hypothetical protein
MPPIETIATPRRNRISVSIPREYSSYSFQVILVPLAPVASQTVPVVRVGRKPRTFVEALLSCPKLEDGESLDVTRDPSDFGRDIDL